MNITIRRMRQADTTHLAAIYSAVYERFQTGEHWTLQTAKKMLQYWLKKQPDLAFVAECDGKLVGAFVAGVKPWWDGNHLCDGEIFVHPKYQKKGIGTELSKALYTAALKKYKVVRFDAWTFKNTTFPLSWYLSQGFVVNDDWTIISGDVRAIASKLMKK